MTNENSYRRGPMTVPLILECADCGAALQDGDMVKIYGNGKIYGTECHGPSAEVRATRMERGLNPDTGRPIEKKKKKVAAATRKKAKKSADNPLAGISPADLAALADMLKAARDD